VEANTQLSLLQQAETEDQLFQLARPGSLEQLREVIPAQETMIDMAKREAGFEVDKEVYPSY